MDIGELLYVAESFIEDGYGNFIVPDDYGFNGFIVDASYILYSDDNRRTYRISPYIIKDYMHKIYYHHELKHNNQLKEKYDTYKKIIGRSDEFNKIMDKLLIRNLSDHILKYIHVSLDMFKIKYNLFYCLELAFNDNCFMNGGIFNSILYSINRFNRLKVVGKLPYVRGSRRTKVSLKWQSYCSNFLRQTDLFYDTMGFENSSGFYSCPAIIYKIVDDHYLYSQL